MLGYDIEIIYKKGKNIFLWMPFKGKKKKQNVHYVLFLFYNIVGWNKKG
jgi:hypothetical protein